MAEPEAGNRLVDGYLFGSMVSTSFNFGTSGPGHDGYYTHADGETPAGEGWTSYSFLPEGAVVVGMKPIPETGAFEVYYCKPVPAAEVVDTEPDQEGVPGLYWCEWDGEL